MSALSPRLAQLIDGVYYLLSLEQPVYLELERIDDPFQVFHQYFNIRLTNYADEGTKSKNMPLLVTWKSSPNSLDSPAETKESQGKLVYDTVCGLYLELSEFVNLQDNTRYILPLSPSQVERPLALRDSQSIIHFMAMLHAHLIKDLVKIVIEYARFV